MVSRRLFGTLCGVTILALTLTQNAGAMFNAKRTTYLTFSQPVGLPNVDLQAGTYIFERADPNSSHAIVRVLSRDRRFVYYTGFTYLVERPQGLREGAVVTLGESVGGVPPPVKAWWPMGETLGHEFVYR
jgi:hypothetical protein